MATLRKPMLAELRHRREAVKGATTENAGVKITALGAHLHQRAARLTQRIGSRKERRQQAIATATSKVKAVNPRGSSRIEEEHA